MTDQPLTRVAAGIALRRLVAGVTETDPEAAASRFLERVAASAPELRDALVEVGARAVIAEARRVAVALDDLAAECRPCPRCGGCVSCGLEAIAGREHECQR